MTTLQSNVVTAENETSVIRSSPPTGNMTIDKFCETHNCIKYETRMAYVTAYNTIPAQCDSSPCISASGDNICGRNDVVACPRKMALGTVVRILGKDYVCLDRTNRKYDGRFDISFDKDIQGAKEWGIKYLQVKIIK